MSIENPESKTENARELRKYIYSNNLAGGKVIFECVATDMLAADKMYQEKTGKDPGKQNYIGCSILKIESDEKTS